VAVERGREWRNSNTQVVEHVRYADGLSQPRFLRTEIDRQEKRGDGTDVWNPSAPLSLALVRDPNARAADAFGSYLVFRKLEQNVPAFNSREKDMAQALALVQPDAALGGAIMVGRFRDGTPVTLSPVAGMSAPSPTKGGPRIVRSNNFTYAEDAKGSRCLFQAHIRATSSRHPAASHPVSSGAASPVVSAARSGGTLSTSRRAGRLVTLRDGKYFFAPSLPFLRGL
jgi:deferrochelatase/peroxidase EfeB